MKIALATCASYPQLGLDGPILMATLAKKGLEYAPLIWNDPQMDWSEWDLCLLHSTWDYHHHLSEFVEWAGEVSGLTRLWNPLEVVKWNSHKTYLRDLAVAGIPTIPTVWLRVGEKANLAELLEEQAWQRAVIKPAVSASSYGVMLIRQDSIAQGQLHLDNLLATRDVMVQPAMTSLETYGEHSLIFIDGELTHAVHRASTLKEDGRQPGESTLITPEKSEIELAYKALAQVKVPLLYARVDIVKDNAGQFRLMELELLEPGLFLRLNPTAAGRLVEVTIRHAKM